jgi:hypothetical protein
MFEISEGSVRSLPELVRKALDAFERKLDDESLKPTLAEYLKLLQFEKECAPEKEGPREVTARWVEPEAEFSEE